jgi:hypothetical protein
MTPCLFDRAGGRNYVDKQRLMKSRTGASPAEHPSAGALILYYLRCRATAGSAVSYTVCAMNTDEHCAKCALVDCPDTTDPACSRANCCILGFMSKCGAGPLIMNQRSCRFFKPSSGGGRCMHYCVALDGHCDSADAQQEMKSRIQSKN